MTSTLSQTPLTAWHAAHGGRMVDFAGWSMPVQYGSIVEEHTATRTAIGLFDVSHMGRLHFAGTGAGQFLDRLLTRRVVDMAPGQVRYALLTNAHGGVLDDVLVYRLPSEAAGASHLLVVNASNRAKVLSWLEAQRSLARECQWSDDTLKTAMIAVQGPRAGELLAPRCPADLAAMKYYTAVETTVGGTPALVGRTGYTGEDGWELIVPSGVAGALWGSLLEAGRALGARPAGLGSRDTLRLEAGMPLYGHELDESINAAEAGVGFAIDLADREFIGRDALAGYDKAAGQRRVGWLLDGRRIARGGESVRADGRDIGRVTSGTFSPTLGRSIAMGYCAAAHGAVGTKVEIVIRDRAEPATVVKLPFYRRPAKSS